VGAIYQKYCKYARTSETPKPTTKPKYGIIDNTPADSPTIKAGFIPVISKTKEYKMPKIIATINCTPKINCLIFD